MLRTYPPRISQRVCQNVIEEEEDGSWNEGSPAKIMDRLISTLFVTVVVM